MREEIRTAIHELDRVADGIRNPVLLETAAVIREELKKLPDEGSEGLVSPEWIRRITARLKDESRSEAQMIPDLLCALTEPAVRFAAETIPPAAEEVRRACRTQKNRIRFVRNLEPYLHKLDARLPEEEREEERKRILMEEQLAWEGLDHLLTLYRQKATEEHAEKQAERLRFLERYEMEAGERHRCLETEVRNKVLQGLLRESENKFQNIYEFRRINPAQDGLNSCSREEWEENNARRGERIDESDEEQTPSEGNRKQNCLQAKPQHPGDRGEEIDENRKGAETACCYG